MCSRFVPSATRCSPRECVQPAADVALLFTFALQLATIYLPWLNPIFKTEPLSVDELAFCLAMSTVVFIGVEIEKWMIRRGWLYGAPANASPASRASK